MILVILSRSGRGQSLHQALACEMLRNDPDGNARSQGMTPTCNSESCYLRISATPPASTPSSLLRHYIPSHPVREAILFRRSRTCPAVALGRSRIKRSVVILIPLLLFVHIGVIRGLSKTSPLWTACPRSAGQNLYAMSWVYPTQIETHRCERRHPSMRNRIPYFYNEQNLESRWHKF